MREDIIKYKNNYLSNVVVSLDFSPVTRFFETVPNDIIEKLSQDYIFHQGQMLSEVKVNIMTGAKIQTAIPVWEFQSKDNILLIQLTQNFLKFNFTKYKNFEDLLNNVQKVTKLLQNDIKLITRLGLRYINQIDLDENNPTDWTDYINDALTSSIDKWCSASKNKIARAMSQIMINEDDYTLNFNYGIYNPIFPNTVLQKQYILDFDCFGKNVEFTELDTLLYKFNLAITNSFEKSIKDNLRNKMERIYE